MGKIDQSPEIMSAKKHHHIGECACPALLLVLPKVLADIACSYLEVGLHCVDQWEGETGDPRKVLVLPSGEIAIIDGPVGHIKIHTREGKHISTWTQSLTGHCIHPVNATVSPGRREVVLVCGNYIGILSPRGRLIRKWSSVVSRVTAVTSFSLPNGEVEIAVVVHNCYVEFYAVDGSFLRRWRVSDTHPGDLTGIVFLSFTGEIAILDRRNAVIEFFTLEGKLNRRWGLRYWFWKQTPDDPVDISLVPGGGGLVVSGRHRILLLSLKEGEYSYCWSYYDQYKTLNLRGVAMIDRRHLIVITDNYRHPVKILGIQAI